MEQNKEKQKIRARVQERLKRLGFDEIQNKSKTILSQLKQLQNFDNVENVFCYISKSDELHTHDLIRYFLKNRVHVWIAKMETEQNLCLKHLSDWEKDLEIGAYGILEPKDRLETLSDLEKIDLFLIPGRAFGPNGERIGRGKGIFDRFLAKIKDKTKLTGICLEEQVFETIPVEKHDIKMSQIITNERLLKVQGRN